MISSNKTKKKIGIAVPSGPGCSKHPELNKVVLVSDFSCDSSRLLVHMKSRWLIVLLKKYEEFLQCNSAKFPLSIF